MRRISSRFTWWHKKAFPVFGFGFLGVFTLIWVFAVIQQRAPALTLLFLLAIAAFSFFQMRWLVSPLIDEVFIDNDEIIVKNRGQEDRFPIANILSVKDSTFVHPERIVLTLKEPCLFGGGIVFLPSWRLWRFWAHPIVEVLNRDIDEVIRDGLH